MSNSPIKIINGTVVSYNLTDSDVNTTYDIEVSADGANNQSVVASPLDTNIKRIPILGESVMILQADSAEGSGGQKNTKKYYLNPSGLQKNIHSNALPAGNKVGTTDGGASYASAQNGNPNTSNTTDSSANLGDGFVERTDVGSLQPFLGDVLIEGRFGHSLRFGYTPAGSGASKEPSWSSSTPENPITILSNGRKAAGSYNKFIIEDVSDDLSSIWLTSSQKLKLTTSNKIPSDVDAQSQFDKPSIVLNSDRILLNSKTDWVVLSGAKSVSVATPAWAMDMDKMFTIIEGLLQQLTDLTSAKATYATGVGPTGPATNAAQVSQLLSDFKAMKGGAQSGGGGSSPSSPGSNTTSGGGGSFNPFVDAPSASEDVQTSEPTQSTSEPTQSDINETDTGGTDPSAGQAQSDPNCTSVPTTWDTATDRRIKTLHPLIQCDVANIINEAEATLGIKFRVSQALRTIAEQNGLYAKGRTAPGGIVTNAKGGSSYHNYGLAFDVVIIRNGAAVWKDPGYRKLSSIASKYGFFWGGNFKSLNDEPHFEKAFGRSTRQHYAAVQGKSSPYPQGLA
jgi:hypothetical protein